MLAEAGSSKKRKFKDMNCTSAGEDAPADSTDESLESHDATTLSASDTGLSTRNRVQVALQRLTATNPLP